MAPTGNIYIFYIYRFLKVNFSGLWSWCWAARPSSDVCQIPGEASLIYYRLLYWSNYDVRHRRARLRPFNFILMRAHVTRTTGGAQVATYQNLPELCHAGQLLWLGGPSALICTNRGVRDTCHRWSHLLILSVEGGLLRRCSGY